ncbi:hypothetical protein [Brachybacterium hainanense]|uniref:Sugar ABC transporter ATPase n=1 Tax=Brachybacterium hainanense TaxID=1541174 RepID=A0ABV6R789_9MICO
MSENGVEQISADGPDERTAAEQGNREGDEMAAEGQDRSELADLTGDALEVDALVEEADAEGLGGDGDPLEDLHVQDDDTER